MLQNSGMWWHIDEVGQGNEALHSSESATRWIKGKRYIYIYIYIHTHMLILDVVKSCHMVAGYRLLYLEVWSMKEDLS